MQRALNKIPDTHQALSKLVGITMVKWDAMLQMFNEHLGCDPG